MCVRLSNSSLSRDSWRRVRGQPAAAALQAEPNFLGDFRIGGDRLFRLGRVRDPDGGHVNEDDQWALRQSALPLLKTVGVPIRFHDGFGDGAPFLVVEQRHAIRETQKMRRLVCPRLKFGRRILSLRGCSCGYGRAHPAPSACPPPVHMRGRLRSETDCRGKQREAELSRCKSSHRTPGATLPRPLFADRRNAVRARGRHDRHRRIAR